MIYKSKNGDIDLSKIVRLYPAAVIEMYGEVAEMSLEWMEMNEGKVKLLHYVLVFDSTPPSSEEKVRIVLEFETKEGLIEIINEVAPLFD